VSGILLATVGNSYGAAPVNTVAPAVTGTATVGQTLSTTNGTWTGAPAPTFAYQWQRATVNISGATSSTYVLVAADATNTIRCVVTATNSIAPSGVSANSNSTASVAAVVPGAPTIGTATAASITTVAVTYTQPASNGGATITSYTATSSPSGITGTVNQAGSGTITVTGLVTGTSYTFTVTATNSVGTSAASAASNSAIPALQIGDAFGGGFFMGQISTTANSVANFNLVVGPVASAEQFGYYKLTNTSDGGASSSFNGAANSAAINDADHPAAQFCEAVNVGGFSDWYLPAYNELEILYFNCKPSTQSNVTNGDGANPYAVPARGSGYTSGTPPRTSAAAFQTGGAEACSTGTYWSSTQSGGGNRAYAQGFNNGNQYTYLKFYYAKARAIRKVAV